MTTATPLTPIPSSSDGQGATQKPQRIYVGIDIGYRTHVAAAIPLHVFNHHKHKDQWRKVKTLSFASDATGFVTLQHYLDGFSTHPADFLMLLEPTGGYYAMGVLIYLLQRGYLVKQVENRAVKDYREKILGSETKTDAVDARLMARMAFLHEILGEEFSIQPVHITHPDAAALKIMAQDYLKLQKEITRRYNQLQQIVALIFPELKTVFKNGTAGPAARALLARYPTPCQLAQANRDEVVQVLKTAHAYAHAKRVDDILVLAQTSAGLPMLSHHQWRLEWIIKQLDVLEKAEKELLEQIHQANAVHPYTPIIESLPAKATIWTAILIGVIGDIHRFPEERDFRAYMGWYPRQGQSGTSVQSSRLADKGVRSARRVFGQMALILLIPAMKDTAFRAYYDRLVKERGMRPIVALGHLAGKLATVLYGMLKTMKPYDEAKHRHALGLTLCQEMISATSVDVMAALADLADTDPNILDEEPLNES